MLFWPRPSEQLSLVDFVGFTARGGGSPRGDVLCAEWRAEQRDMVGGAKQVQHNTVKPIPAPLLPDERGLTWQGAPPCN